MRAHGNITEERLSVMRVVPSTMEEETAALKDYVQRTHQGGWDVDTFCRYVVDLANDEKCTSMGALHSRVRVDAFTAKPFAGNPAAVVRLDGNDDDDQSFGDEWKQKVAMEMALSETAFISSCATPASAPASSTAFSLRWFTPTCEVDLCGHATLATAHVIYEQGWAPRDHTLVFITKRGELTVTSELVEAPGVPPLLHMEFPVEPLEPSAQLDVHARALGLDTTGDIVSVWDSRVDLLIELTPAAFDRLQPDMGLLKTVPTKRGVMVTCPATEAHANMVPKPDFISRWFGPSVGVDEDPVTGSAHCALAPFWKSKLGRGKMVGYQASRRGGTVMVEVVEARGKVRLSGYAVTTVQGVLRA